LIPTTSSQFDQLRFFKVVFERWDGIAMPPTSSQFNAES